MQVQPRNCRRQDLSVELFSTVLQILTFRVNTTGNQNTTGNAATATKLQTARKISGVPFDGSTDITLTAAHVAAFARRATDTYADADGGAFPECRIRRAYNVTRSGDTYILVNFYTGSRKLPNPADEGALQKWRSVLPFLKRWLWF